MDAEASKRADGFSDDAPFPGRTTKQSCSKSRFFRISAKQTLKVLPPALLGIVVKDGTYGEADFTSNMLGRGFVQKLLNSLSSEIKIFPGTAHLLHLLQQQIKILLPIGEI